MSDRLTTAALPQADRDTLVENLHAGRVFSIQELPLSAQAYLAWALWDTLRRPLVWVTDGQRTMDIFYRDLLTLSQGHRMETAVFPPRETMPGRSTPDLELIGDRLRTLQQCREDPAPAIVATTVQALMQKTLSPSAFRRDGLTLSLAEEKDLAELTHHLEGVGYEFGPEVESPGQAAVRGGLLDLWPPPETYPLRIEFFGPVVESIRTFNPVDQRSVERRNRAFISPPTDEGVVHGRERAVSDLLAYIPAEACWVWSDPESIRHHAELYRETSGDDEHSHRTLTHRTLRSRIAAKFTSGQLTIGADGKRPEGTYALDLRPREDLPALKTGLLQPDLLETQRRDFLQALGRQAAAGWRVDLFFATEGSRDRFLELHQNEQDALKALHIRVGNLSEGFESESLRFVAVSESDLYGRRRDGRGRIDSVRRRRAPRATGERLAEWTDIQPADLVVHTDHGIGKYLGLYEIESAGGKQEVMAIEYADKAKLYVPVAQAHLLSRYVGVGKRRPGLHALGGRKWMREKVGAEKAIRDLAADLLETQAARETLGGHAFASDSHWQHEFEAAFPFQETADQERAIAEIKEDMERPHPMERLVCGDVGYGKTEVAMRAAFKAVTGQKQVAMLVPTTILAQQHFDTFAARMEAFPITVAMLSRFQTGAEQRRIVERVREGLVDFVVGTHRLIQPDIGFKDLGLLIIDEEQRFGVEQKEAIKQFRQSVDVLTMTATPIPRTLYMSLTGARDMSTIQTPPQERLPIETVVTQNEDQVVRDAILHELSRDGQVFYLHNRVRTINRVRQRIEKLVPESRIAIAHGQMPEGELASIMRKFVAGAFDVLVCTTIIESGVDIPNVNTILIDRADRFGLADLYQLRGRVGRYKHKAYAYLLLPKHGRLFDTARKRISAIRRYSSLGAGFKLALRDLEIRGAGNLLGSQQSGHIAAVGFDLYCQLLKRSVARLQGEEVPPIVDVELKLGFIDLATDAAGSAGSAVIPYAYVEDENLRLNAYRKLASATTETELSALGEEFRDRYGPAPDSLDRLLNIALLRILCSARGIQGVEVRDDKVMFLRNNDYIMYDKRFPRLKATSPSERVVELIALARDV